MTLTKTIAAGLLLLLASGLAVAEEKTVNFKLSHDAYFGAAKLTAGAYRLKLMDGSTNVALLRSEASGHSMFQPVISRDYGACSKSLVTLRPSGGEWSLASVCFAGTGITLNFATIHEPAKRLVSASLAGAK